MKTQPMLAFLLIFLSATSFASASNDSRFEISRDSGDRVRFILHARGQEELIGQENYDVGYLEAIAATSAFKQREISGFVATVGLTATVGCAVDLVNYHNPEAIVLGSVSATALSSLVYLYWRDLRNSRFEEDRIAIATAIGGTVPTQLTQFNKFLKRFRRALAHIDEGRFERFKPDSSVEIVRSVR